MEKRENGKILRIELLQIAPCETREDNLEKGIQACREARKSGADIALFPEMRSSGYRIYDRPVEEWQAEAMAADSDFVKAFGRLAGKFRLAR